MGKHLKESKVLALYRDLAEEKWDVAFALAMMLGELLLGIIIIWKIPYTEIDWIAYMQEVGMWLDGEYDYRNIYGDTGPLVYPAGFLYLFGALKWITNEDIPTAQLIFLLFYVMSQGVVFALYTTIIQWQRQQPTKSEADKSHQVWLMRVAMGCLCLSKRYHSIFLLRLFNDAPTMMVAFLSFLCFMHHRWSIGCFLFSIAVSLKMNVLLFAPGLLYLLIQASPKWTIPRLAICGFTQVILGAPFLLRFPVSYLRKAFELDRKFTYKWTVNFKFLDIDTFLSPRWALLLLSLHVTLLIAYHYRIHRHKTKEWILSPMGILSILFVSNFIGICCARTLHYQFYCWYFPSLPFLLWTSGAHHFVVRPVLLLMIEMAYLTFPATPVSSMMLQVAHFAILLPNIFFGGEMMVEEVDATKAEGRRNSNKDNKKAQKIE
mmetsp:Transcript_20017/g.56738  ORF Transcript_20017/g.56738 Transcript_20017/m.56738 type:complete len:433 (-) Transcript_20017:100-1398(-)